MRFDDEAYNVVLEVQYVVRVQAKSKEEAKERALKNWRKWGRPRACLVLEIIETQKTKGGKE